MSEFNQLPNSTYPRFCKRTSWGPGGVAPSEQKASACYNRLWAYQQGFIPSFFTTKESRPFLTTNINTLLQFFKIKPCFCRGLIDYLKEIPIIRSERFRPPPCDIKGLKESEVANSPGPGLTTVQFARSVPMSTYLVCFIVCDFDHLPPIKSKSGFDVSVYARRDQIRKMEYSQQIAVSSINYYIDYFGVPYSLPKLDLIAIPDFVSGAMENWGLITFRETSILYDPDFSSTSNHLGVTLTTNHELAHMWFGDLVTMKWWDDLWLNEGFATFMAAKASAHNHPDWDMDTVFLIEDLIDALALDSTLSSHPIVKHVSHPDQITEIFDRISYAKGASVIRMLEGFMGEENFREGVKAYLINFQFRNAETNDLWSCLQRYSTVDKNIPHVMDTWTRQMGYPVLTVTQAGDTITLTQQRFTADQNASYDPNESPYKYKWDVPVTHFTSDNKQSTLNWLLTEQPSLSIKIGNAQWYKLNWHFMGYYRVKYPLEHWTTLTNVLNNDIKRVQRLSRDNRIKQRRAWLLLRWVTPERSCLCKQPACPAIGGGSEVTFKPLVLRLCVREGFLALTSPGNNGETLTVNQYRYRAILDRFVRDLRRFCRSVHSGSIKMAPPVTLPLTTLLSSNKPLANRLIFLRKNFPYPAHSLHITTPDAYVWGMLKENIFHEDPPSAIVQLKEKLTMCIRRVAKPT
ncbi:hypothetical protein J6590_054848 [Homalodisca vitripennis]|nr:hypothetical protein J6590_054848 [Homalodisca vitripennis]